MTKSHLKSVHWTFGLCLVFVWPVALFLSFFLFDSPRRNPLLLHVAWSIWSYPIFYFVGLGASIFFYRKDPRSELVHLTAYLPLLSISWFLVAVVKLGPSW